MKDVYDCLKDNQRTKSKKSKSIFFGPYKFNKLKKIFGPENQIEKVKLKNISSKRIGSNKKFWFKKFWVQNFGVQNIFGFKQFCDQEIFGPFFCCCFGIV